MVGVYKKNIKLLMRKLHGGEEHVSLDMEQVTLPESVSDSYSANYGEVNALGRSSPMIDYANGGPREISFSVILREDKTPEGLDIIDVVNILRSMAYPEYRENDFVDPPLIIFMLGDILNIRGVCNSVEVSWEGPYGETSKGRTAYFDAEVSLSFQEVPRNVRSASDILGGI